MDDQVLDALVRLARGELSVRLPRTFERDQSDTFAYFVNILAEELGRALAVSERDRKRLEQGVTELNELFIELASGDFSVRTESTGEGDPLDLLGFLFDNTVREVGDAFAKLDQQRALLEAVFESMTETLFLLDGEGRITRANHAASTLLDRPLGDLIGRPLADVLAPWEAEFAASLVPGALAEPFRARETEFIDAAGRPLLLQVSGAPLVAVDGARRGVVLTARDERELRRAQAQLQVSDRMATMGALAAGVAHEINNPLAFVLSNLEFGIEELDALPPGGELSASLRAELVRALDTSRQGAERVAQIVRDLKSLSRVEEDSLTEVDLARVLDSASAMLKNEIRHRSRLVKSYGEAPTVLANEARVLQVALNLIQNAAHAIPIGNAASHQIVLETATAEGGWTLLSVSDTGVGIPADRLPLIFDAFHTSKAIGTGTGLGLSICQRLVGQMGGRIEVESTPGAGSTFRVLLPPAPPASAGNVAAAVSSPRPPVRRRVLVIDDEPEIGESVQRVLSAHDVDVAESGPEALEMFARRHYDLVLLDLMMPSMSGREVRDALAASFPGHGARVVVISGGSLEYGGDISGLDCVPKPFTSRDLRALVDSLGD